ncbi:hypothetical protein FEZ33_09980 [Ruoffia tabacinasalis]|uniref:Uncharacterized protein n=1 Tax=Ruoffia tabacinasalis TaxID=87458 RepID=A0A5R9DT59_9LACT|nr:glycosyltransferase family 39 protein [Ruoffia tabacinasalis]TLQ39888.1 hypothetical protein FEZ33_09980 [Ruoffia tabacinasalis]
MFFIWLTFIVELLFLSICKPLFNNPEVIGLSIILIHMVVTLLILNALRKEYKLIFILSYILRVIVMFFDLYGRNIFILPNSGSDSEMYYKNAELISKNIILLGETNGGLYSDILGVIYYFIGPNRIVGQYINVLAGLSVLFIIKKIADLIVDKKRIKQLTLILLAIFPTSIIMSSIFLREIFPTLFFSSSIYFFIKWFKEGSKMDMFFSFIFLGFSSAFHSGIIGSIVGYMFAFLFYERKINKFKFSVTTITTFAFISAFLIVLINLFGDSLFIKFQNVENIEDIYKVATPYGRGDSAYLVGVEVNSLLDFLIYSPIKSIYFLFSPLPWNWRGFTDIITFLTDSCLYLISIVLFFKEYKQLKTNKPLIVVLFIIILGGAFVFGTGVSNAGTAMRHRQKMSPLFLILLMLLMNSSNSKGNKNIKEH